MWIGFGLDCTKKGLDWFKKIGLDFWILSTPALPDIMKVKLCSKNVKRWLLQTRRARSQVAFHSTCLSSPPCNRPTPVSHVGGVVTCSQLRPLSLSLFASCHINCVCSVSLQSWQCCHTVFGEVFHEGFVCGCHARDAACCKIRQNLRRTPQCKIEDTLTFMQIRKCVKKSQTVGARATHCNLGQFLWGPNTVLS